MTTIQEKITDLQRQIDALKSEAGEKQWPRKGDCVSVLIGTGISSIHWSNDDVDNELVLRGNVFRTQEQAERADQRRILIAELRKDAGYYKQKRYDGHMNYYLYFHFQANAWKWEWSICDACPASGYFSKPIDGLIERYGERLNLLREV